jgi:hypothetical protein
VKSKHLSTPTAEAFYKSAISDMLATGVGFLVAGTYAFCEYTEITRPTHDFDVFVKAGEYTKLLKAMEEKGYEVEITDARWLAKITKDDLFIDIIFDAASGITPIDDIWIDHAQTFTILGFDLLTISPEDLIWSKSYRQERDKYEGPDINHIILKQGDTLNWKRLLQRMETHWEILLGHIINFRFVYPADREKIPRWLLDELLSRLTEQLELPTPIDKICRGSLLSRHHYHIDIAKWGYKDMT